jgi:tryptophan synthase alpha chain
VGRIEDTLGRLKREEKKALVFFVTAGFPEKDSTAGIVATLQEGGADMVELGMPFSDPLADGPVIQHSSEVALTNGVTLESILESVARIRSSSDIPLILMGYLNPIMGFGVETFFSKAAESGVDGIILPELPLEEVQRFKDLIASNRLSQILLVTPTTSKDRIERIDAASSGFLYCVSTTGVTGTSRKTDIGRYLERLRQSTFRNPLLVGFGIATPEDAAAVACVSDGVIIGSALIRQLDKKPTADQLRVWARSFRTALDRLSSQ